MEESAVDPKTEDVGKETSTDPKTPSVRKKKNSMAESLKVYGGQTPQSGSRERKSAAQFQPEDFKTSATSDLDIPKGRGVALSTIESVANILKKTSRDAPELEVAHKLVFSIRGKVAKKLQKGNLLQFSGYLEPTVAGEDKDKRAEIDEEAEDELVDRLLDFLGAPDPKMTKTYNKKNKAAAVAVEKKKRVMKDAKPSPKKKKAKKSVPKKVEKKEDSSDSEKSAPKIYKGTMPDDKALREWVKAYVACFNLDKATTKHAMETASDKFDVDLTEKKAQIKEFLTDEMM
eukprot:scaffold82398_cov56-Attheya_sp.AAC.1